MDAIEIFFTVYGALIALTVVRLLSSVVRLIRVRESVQIGWTTPLLALLLLLDICSFTNNASRVVGLADLTLGTISASVAACGVYYVTAALAVPDDFDKWPALDAYFDRHKRFIVGGMILASLLGFELTSLLAKGLSATMAERWTGLGGAMSLSYYLLLGVLFFIRNRAINLIMMATLCAIYFVVIGTF